MWWLSYLVERHKNESFEEHTQLDLLVVFQSERCQKNKLREKREKALYLYSIKDNHKNNINIY